MPRLQRSVPALAAGVTALGILATVGIVLAALYVLVLYQRTMTGPVAAGVKGMKDLKARELLVVAPLIALLLFLGVYPKPLTDVINPAVRDTLSDVHRTDPAPQINAVAISTNEISSVQNASAVVTIAKNQ